MSENREFYTMPGFNAAADSKQPMRCKDQLAWKCLSLSTFLTVIVGQTDLVLVCDHSPLVGLCMEDYKSLCAAVMVCATLVNNHTQR